MDISNVILMVILSQRPRTVSMEGAISVTSISTLYSVERGVHTDGATYSYTLMSLAV